jgi:hypothetical protein
MKMPIATAACVALLLAFNAHASGLGDPETNFSQRLVEVSVSQEVAANDPRVATAREQLARVAKLTGETEQAVAYACMRNARYIFDATRQRVTPLEVLEALAKHAPAGKPLSDATQRYSNLRAQQKLGHAAAMNALAAGK